MEPWINGIFRGWQYEEEPAKKGMGVSNDLGGTTKVIF